MYVLKCLRGQEAKVKSKLEQLFNAKVFVPYLFKKGKGDSRYSYPGYVFVESIGKSQLDKILDEVRKDYKASWKTDLAGKIYLLTEEESDKVRSLCVESKYPTYKVGDTVRVISGLFNGKGGTILTINDQSEIVRLSIQLPNSDIKAWVEFNQIMLD